MQGMKKQIESIAPILDAMFVFRLLLGIAKNTNKVERKSMIRRGVQLTHVATTHNGKRHDVLTSMRTPYARCAKRMV
jgi:hypothetical protein